MTRQHLHANLAPNNLQCLQCDKIKQQAEEAFRELRTQTDLHIDAVQQKLQEEFSADLARLKSENESLRAVQGQLDGMTSEYDARIDRMELLLREAEARAQRDSETTARRHKKELRSLEARTAELEHELTQSRNLTEQLDLQLEGLKSQIVRVEADGAARIRVHQTRLEETILELNRVNAKLALQEGARQEWNLEKAKLDLAYRKRIGEMESEVRRTEIESVRLRKQILSLSQQLEGFNMVSLRDRLPVRKSTVFAIEEPADLRPTIGRITRLAAPKSGEIEELESPR